MLKEFRLLNPRRFSPRKLSSNISTALPLVAIDHIIWIQRGAVWSEYIIHSVDSNYFGGRFIVSVIAGYEGEIDCFVSKQILNNM